MAFKKSQFEPKTSGLTSYAAVRLRLLLDDSETIESIRGPSLDSAEDNHGDVGTRAGSLSHQQNCNSASEHITLGSNVRL